MRLSQRWLEGGRCRGENPDGCPMLTCGRGAREGDCIAPTLQMPRVQFLRRLFMSTMILRKMRVEFVCDGSREGGDDG